jgi:hypothetical protein
MPSTWKHSQWGSFKHDGVAWSAKINAPAFAAFKYDTRTSRSSFEFAFESYDPANLPTRPMIALAQKVLAAQKDLVLKITAALWEEFNGRGGQSGMWWRNDPDELTEALHGSDIPPPENADDVLRLMRLSAIVVRPRVEGYDKPIVELSFSAAFEEEHGVGVLTDGKKILGTGYSADVTPYKSNIRQKKTAPQTVTGRILVGNRDLTGPIQLTVEPEKLGSIGYDWRWNGHFTAPKGFHVKTLPNGAGSLELPDGTRINIFLLSQDESGHIEFLCPGAPPLPESS